MAILNEKNEYTVKTIHLMLTNKCDRDCKYCCNKQYDVYKDVPVITDDELKSCEKLFLTGGEPFQYADPNKFVYHIKKKYPNIKKVYVYINAYELASYLLSNGDLSYIDGLTISIKDKRDFIMFMFMLRYNESVINLPDKSWVYVFYPIDISDLDADKFTIQVRTWQKEFVPAPNSIFRRVKKFPEDK